MAITMNPSGITFAVKTQAALLASLQGEWAYWKLHGPGADPDALDETRGTDANFQDLALVNAATNEWTANPGWYTGQAAASNTAIVSGINADALCALDTLSAGGLLFMAEVFISSNPGTSSEVIAHYGKNGGTGGLVQLQLQYGGNANVQVNVGAVGGTLTTASRSITVNIGSEIVIAAYVDITNSVITIYTPSLPNGANSAMTAGAGVYPGTTIASNPGLGLFGRPQDSTLELGSLGSGVRVRDLFIKRFTTDVSALIPGIYQAFTNNRAELPWLLEGL